MGWFCARFLVSINPIKIFVPAWGWVGSQHGKSLVYKRGNFRPRLGMGWFVLKETLEIMFDEFSSPLGDGLVLVHPNVKYDIIRFSSPSGDGLVPAALIRVCMMHGFRPRVGMGWFMIVTSLIGVSAEFSSPSGDGLFRRDNK